jgi:bacteriocin biosynthesis cyclodehydratase domain-containing protein
MSNDSTLRLKRHYSVVPHSSDVVELRHGTWNAISFTLSDDSGAGRLARIVSRLDGRLSTAEIAAAEGVPASDVEALVDELTELGVLEDGPAHALDYYLDHVVPNLSPFGARRAGPSSLVVLGDDTVTDAFRRALDSSSAAGELDVVSADDSIRRRLSHGAASWDSDPLAFAEEAPSFAAWRDSLVVIAGSTLSPPELHAFNRVSLHHRIPWILAAADGPFLLVGPTFVPWRSACCDCLEARVGMNLREGASYQKYKLALAEGRATQATAPIDGVLASMLASYAAFEALNFALTGTTFTVGKMLAVYLPTLEFTFNEVLRLPGCPACGPQPESDDRELYFELRTVLGGLASQNGTRGH